MQRTRAPWWVWLVHAAAWAPLAALAWAAATGGLGYDPVGEATRRAGRCALIMLGVALLPGPLARLGGVRQALRVRRALGLYAFGYAALHFLVYAGWGYRFRLGDLWVAVRQSPLVWVGLGALLIELALAVTSTRRWQARLGPWWRWLHRLVFVAAALAVVHYAWASKDLRPEPVLAGAVLIALLALRLGGLRRRPSGRGPSPSTASG